MKKVSYLFAVSVSCLLLGACAKKPAAKPAITKDKTAVSSSVISSETKESKVVESEAPTAPVNVPLTDGQKYYINQEFVQWAIGRAEIGGMALTDRYFTHGAAGRGDWYAHSVDGDIQLQDQQMPGYDAFEIHGIGGCVFYTSEDGVTGWDAQVVFASNASNHYVNLKRDAPFSIYLLGDNGVVYEKKAASANEPDNQYAYGEYSDEGSRMQDPQGVFTVSEDQAAQQKLKELIRDYQSQELSVPTLDMSNYVSIPLELVGLWKDAQGTGRLKIDDHYLTILPEGKMYKITEVSQQGDAYVISWDLSDFIERYGQEAVGPGPQPFIYQVNRDGKERVLIGGQDLYSNLQH